MDAIQHDLVKGFAEASIWDYYVRWIFHIGREYMVFCVDVLTVNFLQSIMEMLVLFKISYVAPV